MAGISNSVSETLTLRSDCPVESRDGGRTIVDPAGRLFDIRKLLFSFDSHWSSQQLSQHPQLTDTFVPYAWSGLVSGQDVIVTSSNLGAVLVFACIPQTTNTSFNFSFSSFATPFYILYDTFSDLLYELI